MILFTFHSALAQSGKWAWIHGDTISTSPGHFGTKGIADPANRPPGLYEAYNWTDSKGFLWIYGGYNSVAALYANMWKYDPYNNLWTWMTGSQSANSMGNYVSYCDTGSGNFRSHSEENSACFKDKYEQVWQFGGTSAIGNNNFNDLWIFDYAALKYKWMHGTNLLDQPAFFMKQMLSGASCSVIHGTKSGLSGYMH